MKMEQIRILIVYDSLSGNTEKMASCVAEAAGEIEGVTAVTKKAVHVTLEDLCGAHAIIMGSPTYYGLMSSGLKDLLDKSAQIHGKLSGKVGAAFTSAGGNATGAETCLLSILEAMLIHGMVIQGRADNKHYGPACVDAPDEEAKKYCRDLGRRTAELTLTLSKGKESV